MARQRRSTSAIIGRLASVIGALALIHVIARFLHMWGMMAVHEKEYVKSDSLFDGDFGFNYREVPISFWDMDLNSFYMGWLGIVAVYVVAVILLLAAIALTTALISAVEWLIFQPEYEPGCQNPHCKCVEHDGMVFYADGKYWDYPDGSSSGFPVGIAVGVATGAVIAGSS